MDYEKGGAFNIMYNAILEFFNFLVNEKNAIINALKDSSPINYLIEYINGFIKGLFQLFNKDNTFNNLISYELIGDIILVLFSIFVFKIIFTTFKFMYYTIFNLINDNEFNGGNNAKRKGKKKKKNTF